MVRSMFAAVAGLRAHQTKLDVIGNNIANVNTYGYKKQRATFSEQFYATIRGAGSPGATMGGTNPSQIGYGSQIGSIGVDTGTGGIAATDRGLDAMIAGAGYYMVGGYNKEGFDVTSLSDGNNLTSLSLTRVGIFTFDGNGSMVDINGNHLYGYLNKDINSTKPLYGLPPETAGDPRVPKLEALAMPPTLLKPDGSYVTQKETITKPDGSTEEVTRFVVPVKDEDDNWCIEQADGTLTEIDFTVDPYIGAEIAPMKLDGVTIGKDGSVTGVNRFDQVITIGRIALANVPNPEALEATSNSYYRAKGNTGIITAEMPNEGAGPLQSGQLEMSNVDLSLEMTDMITTQRGFQANSRIITVTDSMLEELVNLKR